MELGLLVRIYYIFEGQLIWTASGYAIVDSLICVLSATAKNIPKQVLVTRGGGTSKVASKQASSQQGKLMRTESE